MSDLPPDKRGPGTPDGLRGEARATTRGDGVLGVRAPEQPAPPPRSQLHSGSSGITGAHRTPRLSVEVTLSADAVACAAPTDTMGAMAPRAPRFAAVFMCALSP